MMTNTKAGGQQIAYWDIEWCRSHTADAHDALQNLVDGLGSWEHEIHTLADLDDAESSVYAAWFADPERAEMWGEDLLDGVTFVPRAHDGSRIWPDDEEGL